MLRSFSSTVTKRYQWKVVKNEIKYDHKQEKIIMVSQHLLPFLSLPTPEQLMENIQKILERHSNNPGSSNIPKGFYIWGGVGIGRSPEEIK
jgi:predicted ATPase